MVCCVDCVLMEVSVEKIVNAIQVLVAPLASSGESCSLLLCWPDDMNIQLAVAICLGN